MPSLRFGARLGLNLGCHIGLFKEGRTEADVRAVLARGEPSELLYVPIVLGLDAPDFECAWAERIASSLVGALRNNAI